MRDPFTVVVLVAVSVWGLRLLLGALTARSQQDRNDLKWVVLGLLVLLFMWVSGENAALVRGIAERAAPTTRALGSMWAVLILIWAMSGLYLGLQGLAILTRLACGGHTPQQHRAQLRMVTVAWGLLTLLITYLAPPFG